MNDFCEQAQKNVYYPKEMAEDVLKKLKKKKAVRRKEKNIYECGACGGWHLTSKDLL